MADCVTSVVPVVLFVVAVTVFRVTRGADTTTATVFRESDSHHVWEREFR